MREGDPKGWSAVLITALGNWEKPVPRGHAERRDIDNRVSESRRNKINKIKCASVYLVPMVVPSLKATYYPPLDPL